MTIAIVTEAMVDRALAEMQARYKLADPQRMRDALRACIMVALTPAPARDDPPETD